MSGRNKFRSFEMEYKLKEVERDYIEFRKEMGEYH
jgi:hypothetical protein